MKRASELAAQTQTIIERIRHEEIANESGLITRLETLHEQLQRNADEITISLNQLQTTGCNNHLQETLDDRITLLEALEYASLVLTGENHPSIEAETARLLRHSGLTTAQRRRLTSLQPEPAH